MRTTDRYDATWYLVSQSHIVYLQGQHPTCRDDTDRELPFREYQELKESEGYAEY